MKVQITEITHIIMKFINVSLKLYDNKQGIIADKIVTAKTLKYTLLIYSRTERPIMPLNIYRRETKQH